jgi:hypothetical protein
MKEISKLGFTSALILGSLFATTGCQSSPEKPQPKDAAKAAGGMDPAAMMAKMTELATPGAAHKELAKKVGVWADHYKMRMDPAGPWQEWDGTCEYKSVLGGRYVQQDVSASMMGMPYQAVQILGYDNMSGEYTSFWMDTMSTWSIVARGKKGADGKIEMKGTMVEVAASRPFRMVIDDKSADETVIEMYDTIPPKGDVLTMTITSKRKK